MELTKFDATIITSMGMAVLVMLVVFPYAGLAAGDPATAADVPTPEIEDFDPGASAFEAPLSPLGPRESRLRVSEGNFTDETVYAGEVNGSYTEVSVEAFGYTNLTQVNLIREQGTTLNQSQVSFYGNETGETKRLNIEDQWVAEATLEEYEANTSDGDRYVIKIKTVEMANSGGNFIFEVVNAGISLAKVVLYIGRIILYATGIVINYITTAGAQSINAVVWLAEIIKWIASGYVLMVGQAESFATIFILAPLFLLGYEAIKILIAIVGVLPTT